MNALLSAAVLALVASGPDTVPLFEGLGDHHHPVTTSSELTQLYFDQGLKLVYGFNHDEAIRSFEAALETDENCAMCYWGIAFAAGPNINAAMEAAGEETAFAAITEAMLRTQHVSSKEQAYIEALSVRYGAEPMQDRAQRDTAYAEAMAEVASAYPQDADAQVLYGDALMNLAPWDYWNADLTPRPGTPELLAALESVTSTHPTHAGACHLYIHAVEKADPMKAEPCAERLPSLMPSAGHIVHMPAHIYIRIGRYIDAIELNHHAAHADERYIHAERPRGLYPMAYYPHNYDFLAFAAAMAGRRDQAVEAARKGAAAVDTEMMAVPELGGLQNYYVLPLRMMSRFGMWEEILDEAKPDTDLDFPVGFWHYAQGMAQLRTGDMSAARAHAEKVRARLEQPSLEPVYIWWNTAKSVLTLGALSLEAEIAFADGDTDAALALLGEAIALEDGLTYDEPPAWTLPPRQVLGRMLLEVGRADDAKAAFEGDLARHPENGWSLFGLAQALDALGDKEGAVAMRARFDEAWRTADQRPRGATY